jgi:hypothetical protein
VRADVRDVIDVLARPLRPTGCRVSLTLRCGAVETETCADLEDLLDHLLSRRAPMDLIDRALATLEPDYHRPATEGTRSGGRHRLRRALWVDCPG